MPNSRLFLLSLVMCLLIGTSTIASAQASSSEQAVWNLEHDYWRHVEGNDLTAYRNLWHANFLGWPSVSATPVTKEHITDWITSQTAKGLTFKSMAFKPAKIQVTGDIVVACYWITSAWLDKNGKGDPHTVRITHTWVRDGNDWRIIGVDRFITSRRDFE